jgi:WD40 repeat protein
MKVRAVAIAFAALIVGPALGQDKEKDKDTVKPILRLEAGGPTSNVTALAFTPDGQTLYAAGFDKIIRGYRWNAVKKTFELNDTLAFRVPIGPGIDGAINAIAVSEDGQWLAVGGFGVISEGMKFSDGGIVFPSAGAMTPASRAERGQITLFNTKDRSAKILRGHSGPVLFLKFDGAGDKTQLASAAESWDANASKNRGEAIVWDIPAGKAKATHYMPFPERFRRPGLELGDARVFLAWEDGVLTRWNWPQALDVAATPGLKFNTSLDRHGNRLLMSGMEGMSGALQEYSIDGKAGPKFLFPKPAIKDNFVLPLAVRYINNGAHAAVVTSEYSGNSPIGNSLAIVETPAGFGFGKQIASLPLGGANVIVPVVAVSRNHIAVGGFPDHRIMIFPLADAVAGAAQPQVLRGVGATIRWAEFVKKGESRGIAVSETPQAAKGDAVFDITAGKIVSDPAGWLSDSAVAGEYRIGVAMPKGAATPNVSLAKGNQTLWTRPLKEGNVTAVAALPPAGEQGPLVAIASYIPVKATTVLEIANGETGDIVRRFVGHTAPIRSLAFRADGKLLVSAGDDQTTTVWSLTDLGDVLGKHGSLGFLTVNLKDKDLTVVDTDGIKELAAGDILRGVYDKTGRLRPTATAPAFYMALWMLPPGQNGKLRIERGGVESDVDVMIRQGTDVRKALFTLFFPKAAGGNLGDWIGWNAIGPYDASRREVEQYLGWHFNTGKADQPTSFAFIDQYRKEYFRPGLLKEMIELGDLPPPPKAPAPKQAFLVPGISEDGVHLPRVAGEYLVRKKSVNLVVTIPQYEPLPGDQMTWSIGNGPAKQFDTVEGNLWTAALDIPPGVEPTRRVTVRLKRTPEGWPALEQSTDMTLRLVAPRPKLTMEPAEAKKPKNVEVADVPVKVRIEPGETGVGYRAVLIHESAGREIARREIKSDKASDLDAKFTLEPGANLIRVRAVNDRAVGKPHENEEATASSVQFAYQPRKISPPSLTFTRIAPLVGEPVEIMGNAVRVQSAKAAAGIGFTVQSEEPLTLLEWDAGEGTKREKLDLGPIDAKRSIQTRLKPGQQTVRVFFKTEKSPEMSAHLQIDFRPPPIESLRIVNLEEGFRIVGDGDRGETPLEIEFLPPGLDYQLPVTVEASVVSKGERVKQERLVVDAAAGSVKFNKLPLAPGGNEIQVRLKPEFSGEELDVMVHGDFVRPPRITSLSAGAVGKTPFADVTARVTSAIEPAKEFVGVTVNGKPVRVGAIEVRKGDGERAWIIEAKQVPLDTAKGKKVSSAIALSLATADGATDASLKEPIVFDLPLPPRPEIVLVSPGMADAIIAEPNVTVRFKVTTAAPLTRVELVRGDKVLKRWDDLPAAEGGEYNFEQPDVTLDWKVNFLSIVATNEGGTRTAAVKINRPPQPVRLDLDYAEILAPIAQKVTLAADGPAPSLKAGRLVLHGSVKWNEYDDANLQGVKQVRMFVNGFQQLPVEMKPVPGKPRERRFQVPVVLNSNDNRIEVDLPDLKQDASNRRKFELACEQPIKGAHLHVLVIAPQEKDEAKLVDSLTRVIKAQPKGKNLYRTDVYDVVQVYVLAKHVQLLEISSRLDRIADTLRERARAGNPNDVVMIYFQGKETVNDRGPVLWTSESAPWLQLTLNDLSRNYLSRFAGGQVLILDTISQADKVDLSDARFAYVRRPDPRPLADGSRVKFSAQLEKGMRPNVIWFDQLQAILMAQIPTLQFYTPEDLKGRIQLNSN